MFGLLKTLDERVLFSACLETDFGLAELAVMLLTVGFLPCRLRNLSVKI